MITLSIIEESADMRESLVERLGNRAGFGACVGGAHARPAKTGCKTFPKENPDVVLMDINLPGMNGIQCVARLKKRLPNIPGPDADNLR